MSPSRTRTPPVRPSPEYRPPRALLASLNGDNSWLLSLPRPAEERARPGSKAYFHAVLNPCVTDHTAVGTAIRTSSSSAAGPSRSSSRCVAALPSLSSSLSCVIRDIEEAAVCGNFIASFPDSTAVDAILLNVHRPDHDLDEATLRAFRPQTLVLATPECAAASGAGTTSGTSLRCATWTRTRQTACQGRPSST